ncbi:MAG: phytoene synthase, partial [Verrucomicrobiales bacterium]|nr:phytoene synthase [Verrucomicrobiales bacterium]
MSESSPEEITKKSKSNLAFALYCLPKKRRADMITFYAFCRTVDDLADEMDRPREERKRELLKWKNGIVNGFSSPDIIQSGVEDLINRYEIERDLFIELIKGMEMDFNEESYDTFEDLKVYCYRVASVVGLISLKLFGANFERATDYAINLGYALQLTNIIRDISEDYSAGR